MKDKIPLYRLRSKKYEEILPLISNNIKGFFKIGQKKGFPLLHKYFWSSYEAGNFSVDNYVIIALEENEEEGDVSFYLPHTTTPFPAFETKIKKTDFIRVYDFQEMMEILKI